MANSATMLSDRLIRIIERRAEELTRGVVEKLQSNPRTPSYHRLLRDELYERVYAVYHDLGAWLREKTELAIQAWYHDLGRKRIDEGIPLAEVLWALVLTKYQLRDCISTSALADSAMELYRKQEIDRLINEFFDRAACYTAEGYEAQARRTEKVAATAAGIPEGSGLLASLASHWHRAQ
jgi:hypothetical protein